MKTSRIISVLSAVVLALFLSNCSEKDDKTVAPGLLPTDVVPRLVQDTWRITLYQYKDTDLTTALAGYSFLYESEGVVTATIAATDKEGTWSSVAESGKTLLKLNLKEQDLVTVLDSISKDWVVTAAADDKIEMTITNEDLSTNLLTFEKN
ncbi:hypothetical protein G4D82_03860 [Flavobacterium sp. CYK-4]|uniref:hypothetical protein n=1 Tax=Flavobacterium lotistagni TaxID=2709660 RepID=UPI00140E1488|nr:hypothetical protein [Flavobacterium lotistagni]NHM06345.1 hypothetical protein [Flavobacterium lotistagni]